MPSNSVFREPVSLSAINGLKSSDVERLKRSLGLVLTFVKACSNNSHVAANKEGVVKQLATLELGDSEAASTAKEILDIMATAGGKNSISVEAVAREREMAKFKRHNPRLAAKVAAAEERLRERTLSM